MKERCPVPTEAQEVVETPGQPLPCSTSESFGRLLGASGFTFGGNGGDDPGRWRSHPVGGGNADYEQAADIVAGHAMRTGSAFDVQPSPNDRTRDLGNVRIHADAAAARSAGAIGADAYTVGDHIVFGGGRYAPESPAGRGLLAHELTHVVQQRDPGFRGPSLQRRRAGRNFGIALGLIEGKFTDDELTDFLADLERDRVTERRFLRDNMARAIVRKWLAGESAFELTPRQKVLVIEEMLRGPTLRKDEEAILDLLENSDNADLSIMFADGLPVGALRANINMKKRADRLEDFFATRFKGGADAILKGEVETMGAPGPNAPKFVYNWPALKAMVDGPHLIEQIVGEIRALPAGDQDTALADLESYRVDSRDRLVALRDRGFPKPGLERERNAIFRIDAILQEFYLQIASTELSVETNQKLKDIDPADKPAIQESVSPPREDSGLPFTDRDEFKNKLRDFLTDRIQSDYDSVVVGKGPAEHADPNKVYSLNRLAEIAQAATDETDKVFGRYKTGPPYKAGTGDWHPGDIVDLWADVEADLSDPDFDDDDRADMARELIFYYLQSKREAIDVYREHHAKPDFDDDNNPQNDEALALVELAEEFTDTPDKVRKLNEIERGWPAAEAGGILFLQVIKRDTATEDRTFLWYNFQFIIHEYLHTLADEDRYEVYAFSFGDRSPEYNTLIEGVASFLTEIVWASAKKRTRSADLRQAVEGPQYAALPFEEETIPPITKIRYSSYDQAARLVELVGVRNLYDAYFLGNVERIGA